MTLQENSQCQGLSSLGRCDMLIRTSHVEIEFSFAASEWHERTIYHLAGPDGFRDCIKHHCGCVTDLDI
jgi:hypothetical protein